MAEQQQPRTSPEKPVQGDNPSPHEPVTADWGNDHTLERVEVLALGAQDSDNIENEGLGEKLAQLAVTTEEEVDALKMNLLQEDERANSGPGSGRLIDDSRAGRIARFPESDSKDETVMGRKAD